MLIKFSVANFRSIKKEVVLDLKTNRFIKENPENTIPLNLRNIKDIHKCLVIYGVNGSGKSNLLKALDFMKDFILNSHTKTHGDKISAEPFLLVENPTTEASRFTIEFLFERVRYEYEFSLTPTRVISEKLIAYPDDTRQTWYKRDYDPSISDYKWIFGAHLKGEKDTIAKRTLENTLFLSKAIQDNHEQLKPLIEYFRAHIISIAGNGHDSTTKELLETNLGKKKVLDFLQSAGLGIDDIYVEKEDLEEDKIPDFFPEKLKEQIKSSQFLRLKTKAKYKIPDSEKTVTLNFNEFESLGIKKLFNYAAPLIAIKEMGGTLIIDEIENNLHCKLIADLINMFQKEEKHYPDAQLIFTTHNPIILETNEFRRDQICFVTKDDNSRATNIYNLSRIHKFQKSFKQIRKGTNLLKAYLDGKFYEPPSDYEQLTLDLVEPENEEN